MEKTHAESHGGPLKNSQQRKTASSLHFDSPDYYSEGTGDGGRDGGGRGEQNRYRGTSEEMEME